MSVRSLLLMMLCVAAPAAAQGIPLQAAPSPEVHWRVALTYDQFVRGDSSRRAVWEKAYRDAAPLADSVLTRARALHGHFRVLVVAESWCSDALRAVPVLARLASLDSAIELRLLRKADAPDLLKTHLLDGRAATPLVIVYDERFTELAVWIERPKPGGTVLDEFLALLERAPSFCR